MQTTLNCNISLSKKLRAILKNGGSITLAANSVENGKGEALLILSDNGNTELNVQDLIGRETSIMVTPYSINEQKVQQNAVTNIFSSEDNGQVGTRNAVDRLAATTAPFIGDVSRALMGDDDQTPIPEEFQELKEPDCRRFISDLKELMAEINESKYKQSNVDLGAFANDRQRAIAQEQKEMEESIGLDAYVVNHSCASLSVDDIGITLPLNNPKNLGRISARKLASSGQLWSLFDQGLVKMITPEEAQNFIKNAGSMDLTVVPELEVYSSAYDAEDAMVTAGGPRDQAPMMDLSVDDLEGESEELSNLRVAQGNTNARTLSGSSDSSGSRRSFHGSGGEAESHETLTHFADLEIKDRRVGNQSRRNQSGVKTISKAK